MMCRMSPAMLATAETQDIANQVKPRIMRKKLSSPFLRLWYSRARCGHRDKLHVADNIICFQVLTSLPHENKPLTSSDYQPKAKAGELLKPARQKLQ
uniref:Uncharacterized protein n=1 Tax=Piliocolobus tephrosceles TaxID=591936 RepID=A0A8C9M0I4_9PRIM